MPSDPHTCGKATHLSEHELGQLCSPWAAKEHHALAPSMFLQIYHLCKAKGIWLIWHPSKIHLLKALMVILRYLQDWSMHYGTGWAHTAKISHRSCIYLGPWTWVPEGNRLQGTGLPFQLCLEKTGQLHFQHCMADTCRICSSPFTEYAALRLFSKL